MQLFVCFLSLAGPCLIQPLSGKEDRQALSASQREELLHP